MRLSKCHTVIQEPVVRCIMLDQSEHRGHREHVRRHELVIVSMLDAGVLSVGLKDQASPPISKNKLQHFDQQLDLVGDVVAEWTTSHLSRQLPTRDPNSHGVCLIFSLHRSSTTPPPLFHHPTPTHCWSRWEPLLHATARVSASKTLSDNDAVMVTKWGCIFHQRVAN